MADDRYVITSDGKAKKVRGGSKPPKADNDGGAKEITSEGTVRNAESVGCVPCNRLDDQLFVRLGPMQSIAYLNEKINEVQKQHDEDLGAEIRTAYEELGSTVALANKKGEEISKATVKLYSALELQTLFGVLTEEQLGALRSRSFKDIEIGGRIYSLSTMAHGVWNFTNIHLGDDGKMDYVTKVAVNMTTGEYEFSVVVDRRIEAIYDDLSWLHANKLGYETHDIEQHPQDILLKFTTD